MTGVALERIRGQSHRAARAKIARDVGELILGDSPAAVDNDWIRRYLTYWIQSFAFYAALERTGNDRTAAREILLLPEIQDEIRARVETMMSNGLAVEK